MQFPFLAALQSNSSLEQKENRRISFGTAVPLLLFIGCCILYGSTVALDYTTANNGADGGDLLAAILTGGIPHPSGYPTYLLLGKLFQLLPVPGTSYFKGALLSLVFASLSVSAIAAFFQRLERSTGPSSFFGPLAAGLTLGGAPLLWSQAVIVEVYGLQAFFTACALLGFLLLMREVDGVRQKGPGLWACAILGGLALGNHLTILLVIPALTLALGVAVRNGASWRYLSKVGLLTLVTAILLYALLPLRARLDPPVNWGNPHTLAGLVWLVSGQLYQNIVFTVLPAELLSRLSAWAGLLAQQAGFPGLFLAVFGVVQTFVKRNAFRWILLLIFAVFTVFSIGYNTNDSIVYLIPAVMVFSIWIGIAIVHWIPVRAGKVKIGWVLVGMFFIYLLVRLPETSQAVNPRGDMTAALALNALSALPRGAVVMTQGDVDTFALWYYHFGLKQRPDITIIAEGLTGYSWYSQVLNSGGAVELHLPLPGAVNWWEQLGALNPTRPVCRAASRLTDDGSRSGAQLLSGGVFDFQCGSN